MTWEDTYEQGAALVRSQLPPVDENEEGQPMNVEIITAPDTEPVVSPHQETAISTTLFGTSDPGAVITQATAVSKALMRVVSDQHLSVQIGPKAHLLVEAWTLMGSMVGVFPVVQWTHPVKDEHGNNVGWEARVEARTRDGNVVGSAESMCLRSEKTWEGRDEFALRSMAQTRATSKALATCLRFIAVLAGYAGTPAEEMPRDAAVRPAQPHQAQMQPGSHTYREGDPCPTCEGMGLHGRFKIAKGGPDKGQLNCTGRKDDQWLNHRAPVSKAEIVAASDLPDFDFEAMRS